MIRHYNIPLFIPELACGHRCVFCDQNKISGVRSVPATEDVPGIVTNHLQTMREKGVVNIAYFGGSFTGMPIELQKKYLMAARPFVESGDVAGIRISTRPDYITTDILRMLKSMHVVCIELGAQSFDDEVLSRSGRGHVADDVCKSSMLIREHGIELGLQMMIGLPGDSKEKSIYTARKIVECGASNTRIYPALVIRGTRLEELYRSGDYIPLSLEEAIEWTSDLITIFEDNNVTVLRVGLHPSEDLVRKDSLVAGPFHISFRELVISAKWKDVFDTQLPSRRGKLTVEVAPESISHAVGYEGHNRDYLREKYGWIKIKPNPSLRGYEFNAYYN